FKPVRAVGPRHIAGARSRTGPVEGAYQRREHEVRGKRGVFGSVRLAVKRDVLAFRGVAELARDAARRGEIQKRELVGGGRRERGRADEGRIGRIDAHVAADGDLIVTRAGDIAVDVDGKGGAV